MSWTTMAEADTAPPELAEELVAASRTAVGDELRSITYFDTERVDQLYLREGLTRDADLVGFADAERLGFRSRTLYDGSELGEYHYTMRAFSDGFLTRVIRRDRGVFVTTDRMRIERFEDLASAVASVLVEDW